ncbi:hypothetical protein Lbir_0265 [Legionella birminghamensis]|uniref:Uncharacterized protein n=2 Tax=Legionella birminghamensis TaxID=28083 RepID=A0A378IBJ0_9GAMM|nr:hypothetical protein [Legionella birminghamensis]KTC76196.1 hypothetical protein Lbir_0265 [Legionella birminghamensis]STX32180.1 Uncharacterised protein [Legionella birminghamensis]
MISIFITLAAFLLAFFALVDPIIKFRLNMGWLPMRRILWILIILGLIAILDHPFRKIFLTESGLLDGTAGYYNMTSDNRFQSFFYEIVLLIWNYALVAISIYLFYKLIQPVKFSVKNASRFLHECNRIISDGIEENIRRLTSEIAPSIPPIFNTAMQDISGVQNDALALLELFSDEKFCKHIVNHNPITFSIIFEEVISHCSSLYPIGTTLVNKLILLMFSEPESQLNREERYGGGLGKFGTFKKLLFGNIKFLRSEFRPLSKPFFNQFFLTHQGINKYSEVLEYVMELCLIEGVNEPDIVHSALKVIKNNIDHNIIKLTDISSTEIHLSEPYNIIQSCSFTIDIFVHFLQQNGSKFPPAPNIENEDYSYFKNDRNIHGAIANGIYSVIEQLSRMDYFFENIRILLVHIFIISMNINPTIEALRTRLITLLNNKIEANLIKAYYPAVTAALIYSFGLCEPEQATDEIHKKLLVQLKKNYLRLHMSRPIIALDMLPKDTELNEKSRKLIRKHPIEWIRDNKVQELRLDKIAKSSSSK